MKTMVLIFARAAFLFSRGLRWPFLFIFFGGVFHRRGFPEWSRRFLEEAVRLKPDYRTPYSQLAKRYLSLGDWKRAAQTYRLAYTTVRDPLDKDKTYRSIARTYETNNAWTDSFDFALARISEGSQRRRLLDTFESISGLFSQDRPSGKAGTETVSAIQSHDDLALRILQEAPHETPYDEYLVWLTIYRFLFMRGCFKSAYAAKRHAAVAITHRTENGHEVTAGLLTLSAWIFLEKWDEAAMASEVLLKNYGRGPMGIYVRKLRASVAMRDGRKDPWDDVYGSAAPYYGRDFAALIRDKDVAFVGPADSGLANGAEIDACHTIIRPNISLNAYEDAFKEKYGSREDIVYLNKTYHKHHYQSIIQTLQHHRREYLVCRTRKMAGAYRAIGPTRLDTPNFSNNFFLPLALLRVVADILPLRPRCIKVFGVDFFSGKKMYHAQYIGNNEGVARINDDVFYQLSLDDPLMSFLLARSYPKDGRIHLDPVAASVLGHTTDEYIAMLSENLSRNRAT